MYFDLLYAFASVPASGRDIEVQKVNERKYARRRKKQAVDSFFLVWSCWIVGGYTTCIADIHPTHYLGQSIEVDSQ